MTSSHPTALDLIKTNEILTCTPETPLSKAVSLLNSSHDAVFVLEKDKVEGVINPFHSLVRKRSYDSNTKARAMMFQTPHLEEDTPLNEIARLMLESKIYFLPITTQEKELIGIVTINRLFNHVMSNKNTFKDLAPITITKPLITITPDTAVKHAVNIFRDHSISHLPVVDNQRLVGMLSQFDLRYILTAPRNKPPRFSKKGNKQGQLDLSVAEYMSPLPETLPEQSNISSILSLFLTKNIGSIVLVKNSSPVGIITKRDILTLLSQSYSISIILLRFLPIVSMMD